MVWANPVFADAGSWGSILQPSPCWNGSRLVHIKAPLVLRCVSNSTSRIQMRQEKHKMEGIWYQECDEQTRWISLNTYAEPRTCMPRWIDGFLRLWVTSQRLDSWSDWLCWKEHLLSWSPGPAEFQADLAAATELPMPIHMPSDRPGSSQRDTDSLSQEKHCYCLVCRNSSFDL